MVAVTLSQTFQDACEQLKHAYCKDMQGVMLEKRSLEDDLECLRTKTNILQAEVERLTLDVHNGEKAMQKNLQRIVERENRWNKKWSKVFGKSAVTCVFCSKSFKLREDMLTNINGDAFRTTGELQKSPSKRILLDTIDLVTGDDVCGEPLLTSTQLSSRGAPDFLDEPMHKPFLSHVGLDVCSKYGSSEAKPNYKTLMPNFYEKESVSDFKTADMALTSKMEAPSLLEEFAPRDQESRCRVRGDQNFCKPGSQDDLDSVHRKLLVRYVDNALSRATEDRSMPLGKIANIASSVKETPAPRSFEKNTVDDEAGVIASSPAQVNKSLLSKKKSLQTDLACQTREDIEAVGSYVAANASENYQVDSSLSTPVESKIRTLPKCNSLDHAASDSDLETSRELFNIMTPVKTNGPSPISICHLKQCEKVEDTPDNRPNKRMLPSGPQVLPDESFLRLKEKVSLKGPDYKYSEVVRKKEEREKLQGFTCHECRQFYASENLTEEQLKELLKQCSRHRHRSTPPPDTPDAFWSVGFPATQDYIGKGYLLDEKKEVPEYAKPRWQKQNGRKRIKYQ